MLQSLPPIRLAEPQLRLLPHRLLPMLNPSPDPYRHYGRMLVGAASCLLTIHSLRFRLSPAKSSRSSSHPRRSCFIRCPASSSTSCTYSATALALSSTTPAAAVAPPAAVAAAA